VAETEKKSLDLDSLILEQAHIYAVRPDGEIIFWNSGSEQLYGWSKAEAVGKPAHELLKTEFPVKLADFISRLMASDEWNGELIQYARGGARLVISSHAIVHRDNEDKPDAVIVVNNDMTRLRKTQEALKQSEDKFKFIATHTPDHILMQDLALRYTTVINPQLGLAEKDMLGKTDFDILKKEDAENLTKIKKRVLQTGEPAYADLPLESKDGTINFFEGSYIPMRGRNEQINGLIGYFRNVTERRRTEMELDRQKKETQSILDSVPAWIFYKDKKNRFIRVNRAFCEVMGMPREKLEGRKLADIYPPEQAMAFQKDDLEVMESGRPKLNIIEQMKSKNGTIWAQTDKIPYYDESGKITGVIGFAVDVTARITAEDNIKKYNRILRAISS
jgi:PAS domain S-box-containing protein